MTSSVMPQTNYKIRVKLITTLIRRKTIPQTSRYQGLTALKASPQTFNCIIILSVSPPTLLTDSHLGQ